MSKFKYSNASGSKRVKGQNNPPTMERISTNDPNDALLKQQGHGICKGLASTWVIAFLNDVEESFNPEKFEDWFTGFAKFQGTYIKDSGGHIDKHLAQIEESGVYTGVIVEKAITRTKLSSDDFPKNHPWAAYCSIWKHDIAFGYMGEHSGNYYIMEPNDGLYIYDDEHKFLEDANGYIEERRSLKKKKPEDSLGLWFCTNK